jgi:Putative auto-transporter adhesin, head GIN domain
MKSAITMIIQRVIFSYCKKLLAPALAMVIFMNSHAQVYPVSQLTAAYKEINSSHVFENIEIQGDVTVILTNEQTSNIMLRGNDKDISLVKTMEKERILEINAEKKRSASKLIVYLPVANMHLLKVTGNAQIFSSGNIAVDNLEIILNGASVVKVYCYGKLRVTPAEGYELID